MVSCLPLSTFNTRWKPTPTFGTAMCVQIRSYMSDASGSVTTTIGNTRLEGVLNGMYPLSTKSSHIAANEKSESNCRVYCLTILEYLTAATLELHPLDPLLYPKIIFGITTIRTTGATPKWSSYREDCIILIRWVFPVLLIMLRTEAWKLSQSYSTMAKSHIIRDIVASLIIKGGRFAMMSEGDFSKKLVSGAHALVGGLFHNSSESLMLEVIGVPRALVRVGEQPCQKRFGMGDTCHSLENTVATSDL
eukprot:Gb_33588 [translate_table: standard]